MIKVPKLDVVFLDTGLYASEGFTSGLLIFLKNTLKKISHKDMNVGILSCVDYKKAFPVSEQLGLREREDDGVKVFEILMDENCSTDPQALIDNYKSLLEASAPHTIIMNTPAVFLDRQDVEIRELAQSSAQHVVHVLADELFPTSEKHDPSLVERLYSVLSKGEVIGVTARIREVFETASGIRAIPFKTVINIDNIQFSVAEKAPEYIGMVNLHPLKGIQIFNEVAARMPQHKFLVVKNWPDVPEYVPSSSNVEVWDFLNTPADFYKRLKLLMIPSLMQEGPTMVIMEALYNGIPVVANRIGSISEAGEGSAIFINPPLIEDYKMQGTILYPICDTQSFNRACMDYCTAITTVLETYTEQEGQRLKAIAERDIKQGHTIIDGLINRWIENIGKLGM